MMTGRKQKVFRAKRKGLLRGRRKVQLLGSGWESDESNVSHTEHLLPHDQEGVSPAPWASPAA